MRLQALLQFTTPALSPGDFATDVTEASTDIQCRVAIPEDFKLWISFLLGFVYSVEEFHTHWALNRPIRSPARRILFDSAS
jgi:hypothetical protein